LTPSSESDPGWLKSCGGEEGWELTARFLDECRRHLRAPGKVLLAINEAHQPDERILPLFRQRGFEVVDVVRTWPLAHKVFVASLAR
jgi:methylase of polypeptide subunit release factors